MTSQVRFDLQKKPMTDQHPITPPPELVELWITEVWHEGTPVQVAASDLHIAAQAARWAADQELEACIEWLWKHQYDIASVSIRAARRPKPPSLKAQAQLRLNRLIALIPAEGALAMAEPIRLALEALPDD